MLAIVTDDNLRNEPVGGVQSHTLVGCVNLSKENASHLPVVGTEERLRAVDAHVELPHADLAVKAFISTESDTRAKGINLELTLDSVVISNPVTPRLTATNHKGQ